MADLKISQMTDASALAGTELVPLVQSGSNVKADTSFLQDFILEGVNDLLQTWNDSGTTFTAIKMNVTDTDSASDSLLMDLQVGGSSLAGVTKAGAVFGTSASLGAPAFASAGYKTTGFGFRGNIPQIIQVGSSKIEFAGGETRIGGSSAFTWASNTTADPGAASDVRLYRDAAGTLALRNSTNAQTFNIYNTYTNDTNYERGFMRWNSNVLEIGIEADGTGSANRGFKVGNNLGYMDVNGVGAVAINWANPDLTFKYRGGTRYTLSTAAFYPQSANYTLGSANYGWGGLWLGEQSADPSDPAEGRSVMWQSDGTDSGDDGDIMVKTTAGGVTKQGNIVLSDTGTAGANTASINNIVTVTQAEYDLLTPDADTVYFITA